MSQYRKGKPSSAVSANLKALRGDRSQADFAAYLGIKNQVTYHRYEAGRVPRTHVLSEIASRIGITIDELMTPIKPDRLKVINGQIGGTILSETGPKTPEDQIVSMFAMFAIMSGEGSIPKGPEAKRYVEYFHGIFNELFDDLPHEGKEKLLALALRTVAKFGGDWECGNHENPGENISMKPTSKKS